MFVQWKICAAETFPFLSISSAKHRSILTKVELLVTTGSKRIRIETAPKHSNCLRQSVKTEFCTIAYLQGLQPAVSSSCLPTAANCYGCKHRAAGLWETIRTNPFVCKSTKNLRQQSSAAAVDLKHVQTHCMQSSEFQIKNQI